MIRTGLLKVRTHDDIHKSCTDKAKGSQESPRPFKMSPRAILKDEQILPEKIGQFVTEGLLMKLGQSWMGLVESKWRERYVVLDPYISRLAYWDASYTTKKELDHITERSPKREYRVANLRSFQANKDHKTITLSFLKPKKSKQEIHHVTFMAHSKEDLIGGSRFCDRMARSQQFA